VAAPASNTTYTARFAPHAPGTSTLTFNPSADAYVEEAFATTNSGAAGVLRTDDGSDPDVETYIRFPIDGLAGKIQSAKLRLFSSSNTADGPAVFPTSSAWEETTLTWSSKPAPSGAALADVGAIATGVWTEWDVTPAVAGVGEVAFRLAQTGSDGVDFHSRDSATVATRPQLVLTVLNDAYPRPISASPVRVSLVPAYQQCAAPNRTHGPPLDSGSCTPPVERSGELTVGTSDANGQDPSSSGFVRLSAAPGDPVTSADEADVKLVFQLTDVRRRSGLVDYPGELHARVATRITDRDNPPSASGAAYGTVSDTSFGFTVPCTATSSTSAGATCAATTTIEAIAPGAIKERLRAVWQLSQVEVFDGGPDGDGDTTPNTVFVRQGVFVP
jgi:hypothetical protein